tara:strand:+ start:740 stop:1081 length:342 start_codon:yes stop_codon:yes gene_type:complete
MDEMDFVTWNKFMWIVGGGAAIAVAQFGAIWAMFLKVRDRGDIVHQRISNSNKSLDDYKLEASDKFAHRSHLVEVENRQVKAMDTVNDTLLTLVSTVAEVRTMLNMREGKNDR